MTTLLHSSPLNPYIDDLLHLIWVGTNPRPTSFDFHVAKWRELMPSWSIRVWTNEDITSENFDEPTLALIHKAEKGVQKADIMRYSIIEKYGGFYMDGDMIPIHTLEPLRFLNELVICHDNYITWEYISIGFFGARPHHPVFQKAKDYCITTSVLNTNAPHVETGPRVFGHVILNLNPSCYILPWGSFYPGVQDDMPNIRFGDHIYAKNWT